MSASVYGRNQSKRNRLQSFAAPDAAGGGFDGAGEAEGAMMLTV